MVSQSPQQALRGLDDALSALAQTLYEAESSPDLVFVKSQADAGGPSTPAAARVVAQLAGLWEQYPLAKDVVERLEGAVADGQRGTIAHLLGPSGVTLADGTTMFVGALIDDLQARADAVVRDAGRLAGAARTALARLDAASSALQALVVRANAVGGAGDIELAAATAAVREATSAIAGDPAVAEPLAAVDRALAAAGKRVEDLERVRDELPRALSEARTTLDEIRRLVAAGADAAVLARAKIANPTGLLEPLDLAAIDGPRPGGGADGAGGGMSIDRTGIDEGGAGGPGAGGPGAGGPGAGGSGEGALGPWLARIEAQAAGGGTGELAAAASELGRWRRSADRWLADARLVAAANGAAVARRNELRGLLQAFRAKSLAMGRAEEPDLVSLHQAAEQALYVAPCDLLRAERLTADYLKAVNTPVPGGRR